MSRKTSVFCLIIPLLFGSFAHAQAQSRETESQRSIAEQQTRFLLFNTTPGGNYHVIKNGAALATRISSFYGALTLDDMSSSGDIYMFTLDSVNPAAPSQPTGLAAVGDDQSCAHVSWNANPEIDLTGYTLYYGTASVELDEAAGYSDSISVGITSSYMLCELAEGTYYFAIRARNAFGLASPLSLEASATVSEPPTQPPLPPQQLAVSQSGPDCVTANWQENSEPDIAGYMMYFGDVSVAGGGAVAYDDSLDVGSLSSKELCGFDVGTYYFSVKAYNAESAFSAYSAEKAVQIIPADEEPPSIAIMAPQDQTVAAGVVTVLFAANDNVAVAGVQLRVDGQDVEFEDNEAPYEINWNTQSSTDGPHSVTATARDAAGNTTEAAGILVYVDNDMDADHPRLLLSGGKLEQLRANACYDADGQAVPACSPGNSWIRFSSFINSYVTTGTYPNMAAWHFALVYKISKDPAYAMRAISLVEADIADGMADERAGEYQAVHDYLRNAAVVYDWLHIYLTSEEKNNLMAYMNQLLEEVWNPALNLFNPWSGQDIDNPGSHRYYQFLLATGYVGLATGGENASAPSLLFDGSAYNDMVNFVKAKIDQQAQPQWLSSHGLGGAWHEGDYCAVGAGLAIGELFSLLQRAGEADYFSSLPFANSMVYHQLYSMQPGFTVKYPGGDAPDPEMVAGDPDRCMLLFLADGLEGSAGSGLAQYWLENVSSAMQDEGMVPWEFLMARSDLTTKDYHTLPLNYYAEGLGWINSRSAWDDEAISLSFMCGDHLQERQHRDQNSFVVYRSGWQGIDAATFSSTGLIQSTEAHNTIVVNGIGQRAGLGTGHIAKYESSANYTYAVGDASDAYYAGQKEAGGQPLIHTYQREIVHIKPDHIIVFDRITPVDSTADITWLLHTKNQPVINGDIAMASNGSGRLFQRTMLPENPTMSVQQEVGGVDGLDSWRIQISSQLPRQHRQFLNYLYPASIDTGAMPEAETILASTDNMIGVQIGGTGQNIVIMFSTDPMGAPPVDGVMYEVSSYSASRHFLLGLLPGAEYDVQVMSGRERQIVVVQRGRGYMTSDEGVLQFEIELEPPPDKVLASR
ncbi:MAG: Ig-like domain-containing protein [Candidatus Latescibacterota bacterium]